MYSVTPPHMRGCNRTVSFTRHISIRGRCTMRKSRRVVEYDGVTVLVDSEHKARRPRKDTRNGEARVRDGRGKAKVFDKKSPQA